MVSLSGRVWRLIFFVVPSSDIIIYGEHDKSKITMPEAAYHALLVLPTPLAEGTWACCLSLAAGSPECWVDGQIVVHEPDSTSPGVDTSVEESGFDGRENARADGSDLEYFDQTMSISDTGPDTSTYGANYGMPVGSFPTFEPSRRSSSSSPPSYPGSSQQELHRASSSSSSFSYTSYAVSTLATLPILSRVVPKLPFMPNLPLTLRLPCTLGPLMAPPPPPYEPLPFLLAYASGGSGMSKKMEKKLRKEAEREAQAIAYEESVAARYGIELRSPRKVSLGTVRTAIVAGLGEGAGWLGDGAGGMGKLMYE